MNNELGRTPDPNPGYRGGALINGQLPTRDIIDGVVVTGTQSVKILKNVMVRYANPVKPVSTDPTRQYGYAYGRYQPGRFGNIGITGYDEMASVVANLKPGKVYSFIGQTNFRDGKAFFEVTKLVNVGAPEAPAAAPEAKKTTARAKKAAAAPTAAPADNAPAF